MKYCQIEYFSDCTEKDFEIQAKKIIKKKQKKNPHFYNTGTAEKKGMYKIGYIFLQTIF
jgi:hypothetical protein